jgi:hypothetical protein
MQFFDLLHSSSSPVASRWAALFLEAGHSNGTAIPGCALARQPGAKIHFKRLS